MKKLGKIIGVIVLLIVILLLAEIIKEGLSLAVEEPEPAADTTELSAFGDPLED